VRGSDGVIAVSQLLRVYLKDRYGVDATYIPNGATIAEPRGKGTIGQFGLEGDDYILTVGRIIPDRGIHFLIEAFKTLDFPLKLVIVGSESPRTAYTDYLTQLAGDRVIFTGDRFGDELEDLYANCRLYVLPSEVEGLPITVFEAMAHRRPLLLSDIAENCEAGGDAASYFKTGNINSLRERLQVILEDESRQQTLSTLGFKRARDTFNWDMIAEATETFYQSVVQS